MKCGRCLEVDPCDCDCHKSNLIQSDHYRSSQSVIYSADKEKDEIIFSDMQKKNYIERFGEKEGLKLYLENL